jgi:hypothetical protein
LFQHSFLFFMNLSFNVLKKNCILICIALFQYSCLETAKGGNNSNDKCFKYTEHLEEVEKKFELKLNFSTEAIDELNQLEYNIFEEILTISKENKFDEAIKIFLKSLNHVDVLKQLRLFNGRVWPYFTDLHNILVNIKSYFFNHLPGDTNDDKAKMLVALIRLNQRTHTDTLTGLKFITEGRDSKETTTATFGGVFNYLGSFLYPEETVQPYTFIKEGQTITVNNFLEEIKKRYSYIEVPSFESIINGRNEKIERSVFHTKDIDNPEKFNMFKRLLFLCTCALPDLYEDKAS